VPAILVALASGWRSLQGEASNAPGPQGSAAARSRADSLADPTALLASTHTKPFIGLPVMSIGRAPGRDNASASCSLPTRNMKRPTSTPHSMLPWSIQQ